MHINTSKSVDGNSIKAGRYSTMWTPSRCVNPLMDVPQVLAYMQKFKSSYQPGKGCPSKRQIVESL